MLTLLYIFVITGTLMLFMDRTYDFKNKMTIPYWTYCTYDHINVLFC